ncbi:MAG: Tol-Pal system beta propeller repeat protein TolB [Deltaproteobacteria bacterium]|nr:Tol-Pal system beta propeller repeat protein TolB [Deltaproteobacteria bacterium]
MKNVAKAGLLTAIFCMVPCQGMARIKVVIDDPNFQPLPIAIPDPEAVGNSAKGKSVVIEAGRVLRDDFDLSDFFKVIPPAAYLVKKGSHMLKAGDIDFGAWFEVGAQALIGGSIHFMARGKMELELKLFEVARGEEVLHARYNGPIKMVSRYLHRFADRVVKRLTGERGAFATRIVCARKIKGIKQIYVMDADGRHGRALTHNRTINILPTWAPDGITVYFTSYMRHNPDLWKVAISGGKPVPVSEYRGLNVGASLSPDGNWIALTLSKDGNSEIYKMHPDGSGMHRLTNSLGIDSSPAWSPDGTKIAFVSSRSGNPHIYLMNADGSNQTRLTFVGTYNQTPAWSPKGDKVAFTARDERNVFDLFVIDLETKEIKRLTQDQGNNENPSWAPNGRFLTFASSREGIYKIYVMDEDGSNQRKISRGTGSFTTPEWSPWTKEPYAGLP